MPAAKPSCLQAVRHSHTTDSECRSKQPRALAEAGYGRGSRIAVALPDSPEFAVAVLAVSCAATCAPLSDRLDAQSLAELLRAMRADALIVREGNVSEAERAAERAGLDVIRLRSSASAHVPESGDSK